MTQGLSAQNPTNAARTSPARALLDWYDAHGRALPWRIRPEDRAAGLRPDPYRIWLSEVMLQQTTVAAVAGYFARFTARWPSVAALAAASEEDVLREWAGLGYYARARNLHRCARIVAEQMGGVFPDTEDALRALPGLGAYTAAAVAAIAFDRRAVVLDGNIERITARFFAEDAPLPASRPKLRALADSLTPKGRPGDYAQAAMDLGATICTPRKPACALCPWRDDCAAFAKGIAESLPRKAPKKVRPVRYGAAFVAIRADGAVLLRKRPDDGLLGGMSEPPTSDWRETPANIAPPLPGDWREVGAVTHVFTHFELRLRVFRAEGLDAPAPAGCRWTPRADLWGEALPTAMKKALRLGLPG